MMVIQNGTVGTIFPADRCTWIQGDAPGGGYTLTSATFFNGVAAAGTPILDPTLGVIGKSGRFVALTD